VSELTIINLQGPQARCCICGKWDASHWGVPVSMKTCEIIANDSTEEWGAKPACESCWKDHENGKYVGMIPRF
jgi:hypothetical protein